MIVLLDRDGVLNEMVVDPEHGLVDSPLHVSQLRLVAGVRESLDQLRAKGFDLAIVTNQPAAAKGKTTMANLEAVHAAVLAATGITKSFVCWHKSEDKCDCRKPKPGNLLKGLAGHDPVQSWMVGDGVTDVQAGQAAGVRTAFLGPRKCDACKIMQTPPDLWVPDLASFALQVQA